MTNLGSIQLETIGQRLRRLRDRAKMTQPEFADIMGVTKGSVSQWESDEYIIPIDRIQALRSAIPFNLDWLVFGGDGAPPSDTMTDEEAQLVRLFRKLDARGRRFVSIVVKSQADEISGHSRKRKRPD